MYTYKNKVTGVTVTTYGKVNGANWERVKEKAKPKAANDGKDKEPDGE